MALAAKGKATKASAKRARVRKGPSKDTLGNGAAAHEEGKDMTEAWDLATSDHPDPVIAAVALVHEQINPVLLADGYTQDAADQVLSRITQRPVRSRQESQRRTNAVTLPRSSLSRASSSIAMAATGHIELRRRVPLPPAWRAPRR